MNFSQYYRTLAAVVGCVLLSLAIASCSRSHQEVVAPHLAAMDTLRTKLSRIAASLPASGTVIERVADAPLVPAFVFANTPSSTTNADVLHFEQLTETAIANEFDLNLSANLNYALSWTGVAQRNNPESFGDGALIEKTLVATRDLEYLVIHRLAELNLPKAIDKNSFTSGTATVEGFVVRLSDETITATYVIRASMPAQVEYQYREGSDPEQGLAKFARSALWSDARSQVQTKLASATGGLVTID